MMKYHSYKDSGIDWLGEKHPIPKHWSVKRVKDLGNYQSGSFIDASEMDIENPYPVYGGNGIRGLAKKYNHNGDYILIGRQGALCGNINYASGKFWATEHAVVVYKKKEYNLTWLGELFRVMNFNQYSLSAAQPGLSVDRIKRLELPIPTVEEQTAIAEYLDTKTQAIDKKVCLLEKKIGYYQELRKSLINETVTKGLDKNVKLKDSGIDWIGQIPEHWEVKRLKDCFHLFTGNSISDKSGFENPVDSIPYVATKDIDFYTGKITYDNGIYIPIVDKSFKRAKPNTTLICIEGANAGKKIGFTEQKVAFVNKLCAIKRNNQINYDKYLYYFTQTNLFNSQFFSLLNGLIGGVSVSLIRQLNVLIPSKDEQVEIVEYLDSRLSQIDQIITNIQAQITTLKELRKTLINDVVTGKIKVNNE
jgi:type I restriction enzyme S subunit